jgi:hypothetical protein
MMACVSPKPSSELLGVVILPSGLGRKRRSFGITIAISFVEWLTIPHVDPLDRAARRLDVAGPSRSNGDPAHIGPRLLATGWNHCSH